MRAWALAAGTLSLVLTPAVLKYSAARAQESRTTGAETLIECRRLANDEASKPFNQGYCLGAVDAAASLHNRLRFCIPGPVSKFQLIRIVVGYIERHPETQHLELAVLASYAFAEAFPCLHQR